MPGSPEPADRSSRVVVAVPPDLRAQFFTAEVWQELERAAELTVNDEHSDRAAVAAALPGARALITAWRAPKMDAGLLEQADRLELVAHTGSAVAPYVTEETRHLIGAAQPALMPDGAGLVNTARSWLVDEGALLAELASGRLDAAIDVFDDEPLPVAHPFRALANVLLTPHQAAAGHQRRQRGAAAAGRPAAGPRGHRGRPHPPALTREPPYPSGG